jgi:hypothetical protein
MLDGLYMCEACMLSERKEESLLGFESYLFAFDSIFPTRLALPFPCRYSMLLSAPRNAVPAYSR